MSIKIIPILLFVLLTSHVAKVNAQENVNPHWDEQKIKGVRFIPYSTYSGFPFLSNGWLPGKIEFINGEWSDTLHLRYSCYKDELLYFNQVNSYQIVIDKASIKGFSFTDKEGNYRIFRKQFYDGFVKEDHFFEVLTKGETDLIVLRNVILTSAPLYKDASGLFKNMAYLTSDKYYFYSPEKGYALVRINRNALLAVFNESDQKAVKKLLRKNRIELTDESSLVQAWKIIESAGFPISFKVFH